MSEPSRLAGVYFDPGKTFADIAARPRWWVPMVLLTVAALVMMICYSQHVGWEHMLRQQIESSPRTQNMTPEQREAIIQQQVKFVPIFGYIMAVIGTPVFMIIVAAVLMFIFNLIFAAGIPFKRALAAVAYSWMTGLVAIILSIIVMFIKSPEDFDIQNPLAFNLGAFLASDAPKWLKALAGSFDLFTFWTIALLGIGFAAASTKRMAWSKAVIAVILPWIVWVVVKTGSAAIFQ
jgi:hypothetical protein